MSRARLRPSPAMIVAAVALFAALGGGAYAGVAVNQVESIHIKNGEVRSVDLADGAVGGLKLAGNAVSSPKVRNGGLEAADLSSAARTSLRDGRSTSARG